VFDYFVQRIAGSSLDKAPRRPVERVSRGAAPRGHRATLFALWGAYRAI
jgi:hypothetical protein